jgi:hypothetical protein
MSKIIFDYDYISRVDKFHTESNDAHTEFQTTKNQVKHWISI